MLLLVFETKKLFFEMIFVGSIQGPDRTRGKIPKFKEILKKASDQYLVDQTSVAKMSRSFTAELELERAFGLEPELSKSSPGQALALDIFP